MAKGRSGKRRTSTRRTATRRTATRRTATRRTAKRSTATRRTGKRRILGGVKASKLFPPVNNSEQGNGSNPENDAKHHTLNPLTEAEKPLSKQVFRPVVTSNEKTNRTPNSTPGKNKVNSLLRMGSQITSREPRMNDGIAIPILMPKEPFRETIARMFRSKPHKPPVNRHNGELTIYE